MKINSQIEMIIFSNTTSLNFDKFNSLSFSTRKNKSTDLTEYYNLHIPTK